MRIPESKAKLNLPVFFLSTLEVAVMVTITLGSLLWSGKTFGAVNVAVEATVVLVFWMLERAPTAGSPLAVLAVSQAKGAEGVGLGTAVVGFGVVVKVQSNVADTSVAPVTVAVIVCDCVGTITENWPVTETAT